MFFAKNIRGLIKQAKSFFKGMLGKEGYTVKFDKEKGVGVQTPKGTEYVPEGINVDLPTDIVAYFKRTLKPAQEFLYEEPPDDVLTKGTFDKTHEALPEYYEGELLPK